MAEQPEVEGQVTQPAADPDKFASYLCRCVPVLLEDRVDASPSLKAALADKGHVEQIKKFLSDTQAPALLVQRSSNKGICLFELFISFSLIRPLSYAVL